MKTSILTQMSVLIVPIILLLIETIATQSIPHYDDEYIAIDDLPVQDARLVRQAEPSSPPPNMTCVHPKNDTFVGRPKDNDSDWSWLDEALKDVAYYLRSHKFNEIDRRYEVDEGAAHKRNFVSFPKPPLRNLHWEVKKYCEASFLNCVEYIWKMSRLADLKRSDDTAVVINEQHWTVENEKKQIDAVEMECQKMKKIDHIMANPFQGPLERYQWRTSASYYMCWFTMNKVSDLRHLDARCDNFANCLDSSMGSRNRDYRADDEIPFACATYSFCPDPCCERRRLDSPESCWESPENPCYAENPTGARACSLNPSENTLFEGLILNHWNVTCSCRQEGYVYDSIYGICVDIDECYTRNHTCSLRKGETCMNTPGSYKCVCKWGHTFDHQSGKCRKSSAVQLIKLTALVARKNVVEKKEKSLLRRLLKKVFSSSSALQSEPLISLLILPACYFTIYIKRF